MSKTHTIIRVKRKRNEDILDAFLVSDSKNKKQRSLLDSTVYTFHESLEVHDDHAHKSTIKDQIPKISNKRSRETEDERMVLNSRRAKAAKEAKYQVTKSTDGYLKVNGISVTVIDVSRHEESNEIHDLMSKVDLEGDFVYDFYFHNNDAQIASILEQNVGTFEIDWKDRLIDDNSPVSDHDSEDSNAEDYYTNDYPEELDSEEEEIADWYDESKVPGNAYEDDYEHY